MRGITAYGVKIEGIPQNYSWAVSFDITDGLVGISQCQGEAGTDRVLLSPTQVEELIAFVRRHRTRTTKKRHVALTRN
jgi:hypothetical protein